MMNDIEEQKIYIVDTYDAFNKVANQNVKMIFTLNSNWYCIRETSLNWGIPIRLNTPIDEEEPKFRIYNTLDEAKEFVRKLRQNEAIKF